MPSQETKIYINLLEALKKGDLEQVQALRDDLPPKQLFHEIHHQEGLLSILNGSDQSDEKLHTAKISGELIDEVNHLRASLSDNTVTKYQFIKQNHQLADWYICTKLALYNQPKAFDQFVNEKKIDLSFKSEAFISCLVALGKNKIAKKLITEQKIDLTRNNQSILRAAVTEDNFEMVDFLAQHPTTNMHMSFATAPKDSNIPAGYKNSLLYHAVRRGQKSNDKMLRHLVDTHALDYSVDQYDAFLWACRDNNQAAVEYLLHEKGVKACEFLGKILMDPAIPIRTEIFQELMAQPDMPKQLPKSLSFPTLIDYMSWGYLDEQMATVVKLSETVPTEFSDQTWYAFSDSMQYKEMDSVPLGLIALAEKGCDLSPLKKYSPSAYEDILDILSFKKQVKKIQENSRAKRSIKKAFDQTKTHLKQKQGNKTIPLLRRRPKP